MNTRTLWKISENRGRRLKSENNRKIHLLTYVPDFTDSTIFFVHIVLRFNKKEEKRPDYWACSSLPSLSAISVKRLYVSMV
jgi:hypothetical protein